MLIALLAVLGMNLVVVVALLAVVLTRKRWIRHQPGTFKGAIRIIEGDVPGLKAKWTHGYGRWGPGHSHLDEGTLPLPKRASTGRCSWEQSSSRRTRRDKRLGKRPAIVPLTLKAARGVRGRRNGRRTRASARAVRRRHTKRALAGTVGPRPYRRR